MLFLLIFAFSPLAIGQNGATELGTGYSVGNTTIPDANASAIDATAIGVGSVASNTGATAIGGGSQATAQVAIAIGVDSVASGTSSTALGPNTNASYFRSSALGYNATTTRTNQVVIGTAGDGAQFIPGSTYTLSGLAENAQPESTPLTHTAVGIVTVDAEGTLGSDGGALQTSVTAANTAANTAQTTADQATTNVNTLAGRVTTLESSSSVAMTERIDTLSSDLESGLASLAAMTALPNVVPAGGQFALGFGAGNHGSEQAFAIGFAATGEARRVHINLGASNTGTAGTTTRGGFSVVW